MKLQDMLIDALLLAVQSTINATYNEHKETCYQEMESRNQSVTQLVEGLQNDFISTLATIKAIITDAGLTANQKVVAIGVAINQPAAKKTGIEQRINHFKDELTTLQQSIGYYDLLRS
jgi:phosphohistidine swiveling domain-containing protein